MLLCLPPQQSALPLARLDALAQKRDVAALMRYVAPQIAGSFPNILQFLTSGGAYGVGKYGWHAFSLREVSGATDVVFSTPLTCEDMGEQVFRWEDGQLTKYLPESDTYGIRLLDHKIVAHFDVRAKTASFKDEVYFDSTSSKARDFLFRLADHYRVDSIVNANGKAVPFASVGGVISVAAPSNPGPFAYTISYAGLVDQPKYAGSVSSDEILLAQDYWFPTLGRQPASYTLTTYTPVGWQVQAQGAVESQKAVGSEEETVSRMALPVVYYSFSAAPFRLASGHFGQWTFRSFSKDIPTRSLELNNIVQSAVIAFYNREYSVYPFDSWGSVITGTYGDGALEAYSYATYGSFFGEDPHEPSHTWWGGILPNSYLKSEWNESFAVFSEGLFQRERDLGNRAERRHAFIGNAAPNPDYNAAPVDNAPPEIGPAASSLGYGKGAAVLQMLESELGMQKFLDCVHEWIRDHKPGTLEEWPGFEAAVNRATGQDYSWFFSQWLSRTGWPTFEFKDVAWKNGAVTGAVSFTGPRYRIDVEVLLRYPGGEDRFETVTIGNGSDTFAIPSPSKPSLVSFDPWRRILRTYRPDEKPISIGDFLHDVTVYCDPHHQDWLPQFGSGSRQSTATLPANLNGTVIIGSPETVPAMRRLCTEVGFSVVGNTLTFDGTSIDLNRGAALAVVDLRGGGHCLIGLGRTELAPNAGRARLSLTDRYGRFLRGITEPKTSGWLTYRL